MKPMTLDEIRNLVERKSMFEKKCRELQRCFDGRNASLLPLLRTKTGRYSERQTRALAARLAFLVPEQLAEPTLKRCILPDGNEAELPVGPPLVEREVVEDLVYCALRFVERSPGLYDLREIGHLDSDEAFISQLDLEGGFGAKDCLPDPVLGGRWGFTGCLEDLLRVVREACCFVYREEDPYYSPQDQIAALTDRPWTDISGEDTPLVRAQESFCRPWALVKGQVIRQNCPVFFQLLDEVYHRLCGHSIREDLAGQLPGLDGPDQEAAGEKTLEEQNAEEIEAAGYSPADPQTRRRFFGEGPRGHYAALGFSFTKSWKLDECCFHDPNLTTRFPNREEFCQSYLRLRRAYFADGMVPQYLWHAVEIAADTWLCRTGRSRCMEDEDFFTAYGYLEQAMRRCSGENGGGH